MELNVIIVGVVFLCVLVLIAFLIYKNQKDKKEYSDFLKNDYKKTAKEETDLEDDAF